MTKRKKKSFKNRKIQATEKMLKDGKTDVERLDAEKEKVSDGKSELNQKLEAGEKREAEPSRQVEDMKSMRDILMKEEETRSRRRIEDEEKIPAEFRSSVESIEKQLAEVNAGLQAQSSEFKSFLEEREAEIFALTKKCEATNNEHSQAKEQLGLREMELSILSEQHKLLQDETLAQTKELKDKVTELESALAFLQGEKREMEVDFMSKEKQLAEKTDELDKLRAEMLGVSDQFSMFQEAVAQREIALQEEHETGQAKATAKMVALVSRVNGQKLQLDSLKTKKNQKVLQLEKERQEFLDYVMQLGAEKIELRRKTADLHGKLDEVYIKLMEVHKQLDDMCQEHKISIESKDRITADLEKLSKGLKRYLEVKGDELSSLVSLIQKSQDTDFQLLLKLRVTEELLTEKEQNYRHAELKDEEDQKVLEDKIAALSGIISANNKDYQLSIEVLKEQLQDLDQETLLTRKRVEKLETDASKEQMEKGGLIKAVNQLEKKLEGLKLIVEEDNDAILALRAAKRKALRQL